MMTALSVARDCGIVPMGQRVILVHSSQTKNSNHPVLYYTNSNCALPSSVSSHYFIIISSSISLVGSTAADTYIISITDFLLGQHSTE